MARYKRLAKQNRQPAMQLDGLAKAYFEIGYKAGCSDTYEECGSDMLVVADHIRLL